MNSNFFTSIIFMIVFLFATSISSPQSLYKINSGIGDGSGTTQTVSDNNDDTMLYIIGGAVIAGVIIYAVLKDKKEKPKDDTTAVILNDDFLEKQLTLNDRIQKYKSQIPINLSLGIQNDILKKDEKRYFIGLAYNF